MNIYIDSDNNIIDLNETQNNNLTEIEIDREIAFQNKTDNEILLYKYIQLDKGFSVTPQGNFETRKRDIIIQELKQNQAMLEEVIATLLLQGVDTNETIA